MLEMEGEASWNQEDQNEWVERDMEAGRGDKTETFQGGRTEELSQGS